MEGVDERFWVRRRGVSCGLRRSRVPRVGSSSGTNGRSKLGHAKTSWNDVRLSVPFFVQAGKELGDNFSLVLVDKCLDPRRPR